MILSQKLTKHRLFFAADINCVGGAPSARKHTFPLKNLKICRLSPDFTRLSRPKSGFQYVSPQLDFHHVTDNDSENPSARFKTAADLDLPGVF